MRKQLIGNEPNLVGYWQFETLEDLGVGGDGVDDHRDFSGNLNHVDMPNRSELSGTISGLSTGQYINIHAIHDNGTPEDGSDDIVFGVGLAGSGTGTDAYTLAVSPLADYRIEFTPEDAVRVFYKDGVAEGSYLWNDASLIDATSDVSGIDVAVTTGSIVSGTISGLAAGQSIWIRARNINGTPDNWDDDYWFDRGITGSGTGTDSYAVNVGPGTGYRIKFNPDVGVSCILRWVPIWHLSLGGCNFN